MRKFRVRDKENVENEKRRKIVEERGKDWAVDWVRKLEEKKEERAKRERVSS